MNMSRNMDVMNQMKEKKTLSPQLRVDYDPNDERLVVVEGPTA